MYGQKNTSCYTMHKSLRIEAVGNEHFLRLLDKEIVQDVTKDVRHQKAGIDFIISRGSCKLTVDTKNDTYLTANCFAETLSNLEKCVLGCFLTSKADYWAYYLLNRGEIFLLPLEATREYVVPKLGKFPKSKPIPNKGYHSEGYLVPWKMLLQNVPGIVHVNIAKELGFLSSAPSILPVEFAHRTQPMASFLNEVLGVDEASTLAA